LSSSPKSDENAIDELSTAYESDRDDSDLELGDWDSRDEMLLRRMLRKVESIDRYVLSMQMLHQVIGFRKQEDPSADISSLLASLGQLLHNMGSEFKSTSTDTSNDVISAARVVLTCAFVPSPPQSIWAVRSTRRWYSRGMPSLRCKISIIRVHRYGTPTHHATYCVLQFVAQR
jgi:hypothetical protein